ncbi:MAG: hypothetical protein HY897_00950 [Deltaproteobacteria bacterium]|nr:hypothetical protein [Deltaproteobacteria bacterium]
MKCTKCTAFFTFAFLVVLLAAGCTSEEAESDSSGISDGGGPREDSGAAGNDGGKGDTGHAEDSGEESDAGEQPDAGPGDSGQPTDAGNDGAVITDAGVYAGQDGGVASDAGTDAGIDGGGTGKCPDLVEGTNTITVDGLERTYILNLPDGVNGGGPWPVIFNWHGLGDTADNMASLFRFSVNDPSFPFILVSPEDTNFQILGVTMDWNVFQVDAATNQEARLFDEILAKLKSCYDIDANHIHSAGFSIGSILTDMLGVVRGDKLASIATFSGAYFSNQDNVALLGVLSSQVNWPAPAHSNGYGQIILHGGVNDTFNMYVVTIHFDQFAQNDTAYLNGLGHDVVLCDHGQGHSAPAPGFGGQQILEFFAVHPLGAVDSPYAAGGLPADYPGYCEFRGKN